MSTAARPALDLRAARSTDWAPWAILGSDVVALETAFALGLVVRRLLAPCSLTASDRRQYTAVAIAMLLLPVVHYQLGLYPGYLLGPVERLRRRMLATLAVFGGLVAWDNLVARGVLSRGVLLATLAFALVLPPLSRNAGAHAADRAPAVGDSRRGAGGREGRQIDRADAVERSAAGRQAGGVS